MFWRALEATVLGTVSHSWSQVNCLSLSPVRTFVTAGGYSSIRAFDVNRYGEHVEPVLSCAGHTGNVTAIGYETFERYLYSASEDTTAKIWDIKGASSTQLNLKLDDPIHAGCLHPHRAWYFLGDHVGTLHCWDLVANRLHYSCELPTGSPIKSLSISADGQLLVAASFDGVITVLECDAISTLGVRGRRLPQRITPLQTLVPHEEQYVPCVRFGPVGWTFASVSAGGTAAIWTAVRCRIPEVCSTSVDNRDGTKAVAVSGTPASLVTSVSENDASLNDSGWPGGYSSSTPSRKEPRNQQDSSGRPNSTDDPGEDLYGHCGCLKSQDEGYMGCATTFSHMTRQAEFKEHTRWVWDCAFSADGRYALTASADTTARLWDSATGAEVLRYTGHHTKPVTSVLLMDGLTNHDGLSRVASQETDSVLCNSSGEEDTG